MKQNRFSSNSYHIIWLALLIVCPLTALANNAWSYHQEIDRLTNRTYSFAQSPIPRRGMDDYIRLGIVCKENKLQAVIEAENLIASQGSSFEIEYQIDEKTPFTVQMKTFPDSKRKGYTDEFAKHLAEDLLTGQAIFIRVKTMIKKLLSSSISLENAAEPIKHVLSDCSLGSSDNLTSQSVYSLAEFEQDFNKLSLEQRQQVLAKIKKIVTEIQ